MFVTLGDAFALRQINATMDAGHHALGLAR
jgi:hypothetical protein